MTEQSTKFYAHFVALALRLAEQLYIDVAATPDDMQQWQKDADAITRLSARGLITQASAHAARRALAKKIISNANANAGHKQKPDVEHKQRLERAKAQRKREYGR